jgi:2-oxoglutarate dehydrogenase E1 component
LIETGAETKAEDIFIGMAHRGRLNVLAHVLEKSYTQIFREFEDTAEEEGSGDVKYHKGAHANLKTPSGHFVEVALAPNPSHLESVDPVVEGQTRAKQELKNDTALREAVIPVLVHGDASLAGQGVVYEILQMRALKGYTTGGTVHIVLNNNIGYTTLPEEGRSTLYCTDIAKTFGAPVFHINAEDPESCIIAAALAMKFRQTFHIDVFIELNCYRRHGHNEGDEPTFTQPLEYKVIKEKQSIRQLFKQTLLQKGVFTEKEMQEKEALVNGKLQEALIAALSQSKESQVQESVKKELSNKESPPFVPAKTLRELAESFCTVPKNFHIHSKLQRLLGERLKMDKIDWGMGEHLAFASLLFEKFHVRLSGQDVERCTFSHRHCVWIDQETGEKYSPLNHLSKEQAPFAVYNSLLSEFAVMGFDLGYSLAYPKSLVLWEAQFGDFVNGSQVIIDQYLATSEQKWARRSNLTLLLPHGYEGKGPEHSSAKMERFLQLCAEDNLIVANCTTPAQLFHLLRRQAYLVEKRPLIVFTPKLLLRHPACTSSLEDFTSSRFLEVLSDPNPPKNPTRVLFCSGKVFYDLVQEREKRKEDTSLIIRLEQLYPFPKEAIAKVLEAYPSIQKIIWVQEEQKNMGAWSYMQSKFEQLLGKTITYVGRKESASPAAGSYSLHKKQYEIFMEEAFLLENEARQ